MIKKSCALCGHHQDSVLPGQLLKSLVCGFNPPNILLTGAGLITIFTPVTVDMHCSQHVPMPEKTLKLVDPV